MQGEQEKGFDKKGLNSKTQQTVSWVVQWPWYHRKGALGTTYPYAISLHMEVVPEITSGRYLHETSEP